MAEIAELPDSLRLIADTPPHAARKAVSGIELDLPGNVAQGKGWLATQPQPTEGVASDLLYQQAARLFDYGLSTATVLALLEDHSPSYTSDDIANRVANALKHRQNEVGARGGEGVIMAGVEEWLTERRVDRAFTHHDRGNEILADDLQLFSGDDVEPEAIDWLWPGHYARGKFHLFAAKPETGKNLITISIAAILSRGDLWPDGTQAPQGDTLMWSGEDSFTDTTLPRYLAAGGIRSRLHGIGVITDAITGAKRPFNPAKDVPALVRAAAKLPDLRYIIIDPVSVVVAGGRGASNNNAETRIALQPLVDLARDRQLVVEGITHFAKDSNRRDVLERVIESTAFSAVARIVHVAHKFADLEKPRIWARAKANIVKATREIGFEYQPIDAEVPGYLMRAPRCEWGKPAIGELSALMKDGEPDGIDTPRGKAKLWLRQLLADAPGGQLPTKEIEAAARANGIAGATLTRAREELPIVARQNLGAQHGGWYWKWTAEDEIASAVSLW